MPYLVKSPAWTRMSPEVRVTVTLLLITVHPPSGTSTPWCLLWVSLMQTSLTSVWSPLSPLTVTSLVSTSTTSYPASLLSSSHLATGDSAFVHTIPSRFLFLFDICLATGKDV